MKKFLIAFLPIIIAFLIPIKSNAKTETYISETAQKACVEYGEQYSISPELLMAIIETESSGQSDAENGGCYGLMQISVKWHKDRMERLGVTDIFDERSNILVGADYLAELFEKYEDVGLVLGVYHGEENAVAKYKRGELSNYTKGILDRSAELEDLHGK